VTSQNDRYRFDALLSAIQNAGSVLLFPHISPDGDTLGSTLALKMLLERLKKPVSVILDDVPPASLSFLPDIYCVRRYNEKEQAALLADDALAIAVDVSSDDRMGGALTLFSRVGTTAQIDHHPTNPGFAQINVIDGNAPASAVLRTGCLRRSGCRFAGRRPFACTPGSPRIRATSCTRIPTPRRSTSCSG
jgi:nanoRNase/pAp phosphatase (c-di-AMP/oligoRNAs hydrolase)